MVATYANALATELLTIQVGDGAIPEVFAHPASINHDRSVEMSADVAVNKVPRTDDPTKPMKTTRQVVATDSKITGGGTMDAASFKAWADWWQSGAPKNIKANNGKTGALVLTGPYVLTQLQETGSQQGELVTCQITLEQADQPTISAAP